MDSGILTTATNTYITAFTSYLGQFLIWGKWIFSALLISNMIWLWLWYAIDKDSIKDGMSAFLKKFFIVMLFYTIMINHDWLLSILQTSEVMGQTLTNIPMDPASVLSNGIKLANKVIQPFANQNLITAGFSMLVGLLAYAAIMIVFISIALELSLTLIMSTALITVSTFFLGFAALGATSQIARQTLDVLLGMCVKLLSIYLVIGAGSKTLLDITAAIPTSVLSFDDYGWLLASIGLFWLLAKNLPNQIAKIVSNSVHETQGKDAAAIAFAVARIAGSANMAVKAAQLAAKGVAAAAQLTGSTAGNASAHFQAGGITGKGAAARTIGAAAGAAKDFSKAGLGMVSDHFKNLGNKLIGGPGGAQPISGVSQRLYDSGQTAKSEAIKQADAAADAHRARSL